MRHRAIRSRNADELLFDFVTDPTEGTVVLLRPARTRAKGLLREVREAALSETIVRRVTLAPERLARVLRADSCLKIAAPLSPAVSVPATGRDAIVPFSADPLRAEDLLSARVAVRHGSRCANLATTFEVRAAIFVALTADAALRRNLTGIFPVHAAPFHADFAHLTGRFTTDDSAAVPRTDFALGAALGIAARFQCAPAWRF